MFCKKKKKKKKTPHHTTKKMPAKIIDGKTAVTELVQELDRTRRELAKSTLVLSQAETANMQLKESLSIKEKTLSQLQQELVERDASHRLEVTAVAQGSDTHHQVSNQKIHFLESEVDRLRKENEVLGEYMTQNQQLRQVLTQAHDALAELQRANAELRSKMVSEIQSKTHSLEEEMNRRLVESERKLREDAFNALSEESKVALAGNDKLQTVLQRQNETLDSVLQRCKDLEEAQSKVEEERLLIENDASTQQREINRLHRILDESNDRGYQLEDALKQRRVERASFELLFVEHNAIKEQLEKEKDKGRRALREADRWREKSYTLAEQLGSDEKRDAIMKLQAIASHSELLERNAERNKKRKDRIRESRKKNAEVAQAVQNFESGVDERMMNQNTNNDDDEDEDDENENENDQENENDIVEEMFDTTKKRQGKLQVSAMDILAIWNVNYQNEDAGYFNNSTTTNNNNHHNVESRKEPTTLLPPIHKNNNSSKPSQQLVVDQQRAQRDLGLSVTSAPKLPHSHNIRRLKEANDQHHQRAAMAKNEMFAISGSKQAIPPSVANVVKK